MFFKDYINLHLAEEGIHTTLVKQDSFTCKIEIIKTIIESDGYIFILKIKTKPDKDDYQMFSFSRKIYFTIDDAREAAYKHLTKYLNENSNYLKDIFLHI